MENILIVLINFLVSKFNLLFWTFNFWVSVFSFLIFLFIGNYFHRIVYNNKD